ncbi:MAG: Spy0128 family protein, partial [Coriobacteriales bacterium]
MKRTTKTVVSRIHKAASWVFSIALVFSMTPVGAFAAPSDDLDAMGGTVVEQPAGDATDAVAEDKEGSVPATAEATDDVAAGEAAASTPHDDAAYEPSAEVEDADGAPASAATAEDEPAPAAIDGADDADPDAPAADFAENEGTEAADVQGEAVEDEQAAADALEALDGVSAAKVEEVAAELLGEPDASFSLMDDGDDPDGDGVPRQGDGSNIEGISARWIVGEETIDDPLLYINPSGDTEQSVRLQVNYALSGEHSYEPGDITITVPAYIFHKRGSDKANYGDIVIPYPEDPSTRNDFNYKLVGDTYVITNTKRMSAATKGYIQFAFDGLTPHDLVDMQVSDPFDAFIEVVTHKGNTIDLRSNELTAQFDTEAKVTSASKRVYDSIERVPASEIPASQRIEGEEEYIKVNWYAWCNTTANTVYALDVIDAIDPGQVVIEAEGVEQTEADFHGFIIGAGGDGTELSRHVATNSYRSGQSSYIYFSTAYPASQFQKNTEYTFHNKVTYTLTEVDPAAGDDPRLVTTQTADAQTTWSFRDPKWANPDGHFMVVKNGNDDKSQHGVEKYNYTHHKSYGGSSFPDTHLWSRAYSSGWYGIYPSALNDLQDEYADDDDDDSIRLSYTVDTVGYVMPWMYDEATDELDDEGNLISTRKSKNYRLPVSMTTSDLGPSIGRNGEKLAAGEDFDYVSVEFPADPRVYYGKPHNIKPDGTWENITAGDGTFLYTVDDDKSHWPDIELEVLVDGEWQKVGTASWSTGSFSFARAGGSSQSDRTVALPEGAESFRTLVTLQNTSTDGEANIALQAALDYDVRVNIELHATDEIEGLIEGAFEKSSTPELAIWNEARLVPEDAAGNEIGTIDNDGYDSLRGYTTDVTVHPYKTAKQSARDVDYEKRTVTVHYTAKVEERSVINDKVIYEQAVADGRLAVETHGVWRDLLPKGMTPDLATVTLSPASDAFGDANYVQRTGDAITAAYTIEDYGDTGRTMLVVEVDLAPTPQRYRSGDMYYYEDVPRIAFDATLDFDSLVDYGKDYHNVISFESSNDEMGTVERYRGEPDDPDGGNNIATPDAFADGAEKRAMTDLDLDRDTPSFVYAGAYSKIDILSAARTSLSKDVQVNNDGRWSDGLYYDDPDENKRTVFEGGQYAYRLRMMSDSDTISKDLVIYDSLEDFEAGQGNDAVDIDAPRWQGRFEGVDTSQLVSMGCAPVVYYSTSNLQLSDERGTEEAHATGATELDDADIWTPAGEFTGDLADVKAIAVDASKKADGSDFVLQPRESAVVIVHMRAPSGEEARAYLSDDARGDWGDSAQAYNNAYLLCTSVDAETGDADSDKFVRKDYTKVGLVEHRFTATKAWDDDSDRDGIRPETVTLTLCGNGEPVLDDDGNPVSITLDGTTEETPWTAVFEHLPYTDADGNKTRYSVSEDVPEGYTVSLKPGGETAVTVVNVHKPELISVAGTKAWIGDEGDEDARPATIAVQLYADGKLAQTKTVKPDDEGNWEYRFDNLYRYRNGGEEIAYTVREVRQSSGAGASYVPIDPVLGYDVVNVYHPYGDLTVGKTVADATPVSEGTEFPFTFEFTRGEGDDAEPVSDDFEYEILDADGGIVSTGTLTRDDRTVSIVGGQRIHVKEIPEHVHYTVTEERQPGFTPTTVSGDEGSIRPNETQEARFVNTYSAKAQLSIPAVKTLLNRELQRHQFRFELYRVADDGTETLVRTASNDRPGDPVERADGTIASSTADVTFGALHYTQADAAAQLESGKPYTYHIKEVGTGKDGYVYDTRVHTVRVSIVDNGDGTLTVTPESVDYICPDCGGDGCTSTLFDMPVTDGIKIVTDPAKIDTSNTTQYMTPSYLWTADRYRDGAATYQRFLTTVAQLGEPTYSTFENTYTGKTYDYVSSIEFTGHSGRVDSAFRAFCESVDTGWRYNGAVLTSLDAYRDGVGKVVVTMTGPHYRGSSGDFVYLKVQVYPVCTTCNGQGVGEPGTAVFKNDYHAEGEYTLRAWKDLKNRRLVDDEFTFELLDEDGNVIQTTKNTADGSIVFDAIRYDETDIGKTHVYGVREVPGDDPTVNYDDSVYGYTVEVLDNGDGTLSFSQGFAEPIMGERKPIFNGTAYGQGRYVKIFVEGTDLVVGAGDMGSSARLAMLLKNIDHSEIASASDDAPGSTPVSYSNLSDAEKYAAQCWYIPYEKNGSYVLMNCLTGGQIRNAYSGIEVYGGPGYNNAFMYDDVHLQRFNDGVVSRDGSYFLGLGFENAYDHATIYSGIYASVSQMRNYRFEEIDEDDGYWSAGIIGWNTEEGELPVFENTLKPGALSVSKLAENAGSADPDQPFRFKVKLVGESVRDDLVEECTITPAGSSAGAATVVPVAMSGGMLEIDLRAGEKATFDNLPAGTAYQVWEETSDGWILVEQSKASGSIEALETAEASFTNRYQPGTATVQFSGTKTLDGRAAEAGAYSFELTETTEGASGKVTMLVDGVETEVDLPYAVATTEGGFVQFPVIVYGVDDVGTHTYEIAEVNPNDNAVDYDMHKEVVTVDVSGDINGLSAATTVDADGDGRIAFANKTRPGKLSIYKGAYNTSDANRDDVFTFKVTLSNANGIPLGSGESVYWYTSDWYGNIKPNAPAPGSEPAEPEEPSEEPSDEPGMQPMGAAKVASDGLAVAGGWLLETASAAQDSGEGGMALMADDAIEPAEDATVAHAGVSGTVRWEIYTDGTMVLRPTSGESGTLAVIGRSNPANTTTAIVYPPWHSYAASIKQVVVRDTVKLNTRATNLFADCSNLERVDLKGLDTSGAVDIFGMFYGCFKFREADLSGWDTGNVTDITGTYRYVSGPEERYTYYGMFAGCSSLEKVDLTGWDLSHVANFRKTFSGCSSLNEITGISSISTPSATAMNSMFAGCSSLEELDLGNFDTSNVYGMEYMFDGCSSLKSLNVTSFDTSKVNGGRDWRGSQYLYVDGGFGYMFRNCSSLTKLDISSFTVSSVENFKNAMFSGCANLREVKLGEGFKFYNRTYLVQNSNLLPTPPSPYTGKWVKSDYSSDAYTPLELCNTWNANAAALAGTWVWEIEEGKGIVHFDANGGYIADPDVVADSEDFEVAIPAGRPDSRPHYTLVAWTTGADGSGASFAPGSTASDLVRIGETVTLYAQWEPTLQRKYTVHYHLQNENLDGYTDAGSKAYYADYGTEVEAELVPADMEQQLRGYRKPEPQRGIVAEDDSLEFDYYYDRMVYYVEFDGNGADSGQMNEPQRFIGDVYWSLRSNVFQKKGSIFTGWNTEPDGSGTAFTNMQAVRNLAEQDGETIRLYAQWLDNEAGKVEPTNGEFYVYCRPRDFIVIPDLPAGTTYTVEEVDNPDGWTMTDSYNTSGNIVANTTSSASFQNTYSAQGAAYLTAHKLFEGNELADGQFAFELLDDRGTVLQTKTNGEVDTAPTVPDDEGKAAANPWMGTAPVVFDPIPFTQPGTYRYQIREKAGTDASCIYDAHVESVTVNVTDAGHGELAAEVVYDDDGALFTNSMQDASLRIAKETEGAPDDDVTAFDFPIVLLDAAGNTLEGEYPALKKTVDYALIPEVAETRYSHTPNVDDEGGQSGYYANNANLNQVVTVDGAQRLEVTITYGTEGANWDWVCMWEGAQPGYTAYSNWGTSLTGMLGGVSPTNPANTKTYSVDGDTVTFGFRSDGGGSGYGYYAVVKGIVSEEAEEGVEELAVASGDTLHLKGGESILVEGLPHGATYTVTESEKDGWELVSHEGDEGTLVADQTAEAAFVNRYQPHEEYSPGEGTGTLVTLDLPAAKRFDNGRIGISQFTFELIDDATGEVVKTASTDSFGTSESAITFPGIEISSDGLDWDEDAIAAFVDGVVAEKRSEYEAAGSAKDFDEWLVETTGMGYADLVDQAEADAYGEVPRQKTVTFTAREIAGDDGGVTYDGSNYSFKVVLTEAEGELSTDVTCWKLGAGADGDQQLDSIVFENTYDAVGSATLSGTKTIEGRDFREGDGWTFTLVPVTEGAPVPEKASTTISPVEGGSCDFDIGPIPFELADLPDDGNGGHADKTFTYRVEESGAVAGVANDSARTVDVTVHDNGDGTMSATPDYGEGADGLAFTNTFTPATIRLQASKAFNDWSKAGSFELKLTPVDGAPMPGGAAEVVKTVDADNLTASFG